MAFAYAHSVAIAVELGRREKARVIVLVARERQGESLDRVGDEDRRPVVVDRLEGMQQIRQIMSAEIAHQGREFRVRATLEEAGHVALVAEIVQEPLAPSGAALERQRRIELVRRRVDPLAQSFSTRLLERSFLQGTIFENDDIPTEGAENGLEAGVETLADHGIEALAVIVDDPPAIAQALLPPFEQGLEDVTFIHLRIAHERDHSPFGPILRPAMGLHVILHQAREERLRDAQADRAGREIDVVDILRP